MNSAFAILFSFWIIVVLIFFFFCKAFVLGAWHNLIDKFFVLLIVFILGSLP